MKNNLRHPFAGASAQNSQASDVSEDHAKSVVAAVIHIDGKIPVFLRSKGDDIWYDLPGGKRDRIDATNPESPYESIFDAVKRELQEELGIEACAGHEFVVDSMPHPRIEGATKTFIHCHHISGIPYNRLPDEHDDLLMLEPQQAIDLLGARISPSAATALLDLGRIAANEAPKAASLPRPSVFGS